MDDKLFETICNEVAETNSGLPRICKENKTCWETFRKYREQEPDRIARYARARSDKYERLFDELQDLEIEMLQAVQSCDPKYSNAIATAYRTRIDNLKWALSKLIPAFREKLEIITPDKIKTFISGVGLIVSNYVSDDKRESCLKEIADLMDKVDNA